MGAPASRAPPVAVLPDPTSTMAGAAGRLLPMKQQPEAKIGTAYIGEGAPRFFLAYNPELPDPSFAKIIVLTPDEDARGRLKSRLREAVMRGLAPEARVRATQLVFGPYSPFPVAFRVMGPDIAQVRTITARVLDVMRANPHMRQVNTPTGANRRRLSISSSTRMSPADAAQQLQFR